MLTLNYNELLTIRIALRENAATDLRKGLEGCYDEQRLLADKLDAITRHATDHQAIVLVEPATQCSRCGEADRTKGEHGMGRCVSL